MSVIKFLEKILPFLFKAAKREYDSLPQSEKDALQQGSGIFDIINTEVDKTPAEIRALIIAKYPNLDEAKMEAGLFEVAHTFNLLVEDNNFDDLITKLKAFLATQEGSKWEGVIQSMANILTIVFSPTTVFAKIGMLMEYVYRKFIKK